MIYLDFDGTPRQETEFFLVERSPQVYTYTCEACYVPWWGRKLPSGSVRVLLSNGYASALRKICQPETFSMDEDRLTTIRNYIEWCQSIGTDIKLITYKGVRLHGYPPLDTTQAYAVEYSYDGALHDKIYFDLCLARFLTCEFCPNGMLANSTAEEYVTYALSKNWVNCAHLPIYWRGRWKSSEEIGRAMFHFLEKQKDRVWSGSPITKGSHVMSAGISYKEWTDFYGDDPDDNEDNDGY